MTDIEQVARAWFEEVWNKGRREAIVEMMTPKAVVHDGGVDTIGPDGFYPFFERIRGAFSELHVSVEETIAAGNKVCVRWTCAAKHTGGGLGIPPSGKYVHVTGISILRVLDGKLVEGWQNWDMMGMVEQITGGERAATYIGA